MLSANELENITKQSEHETQDQRKEWRDIDHVLVVTERQAGKSKSKTKTKSGGSGETEYSLKPDISLRLNYDRYNVLLRDEAIIHATEERWNRGAGVVMRAILSNALRDDSTMIDDRTPYGVGLNEILDKIPKESIGDVAAGMDGAKTSRYSEAVKQYLRVMAEEDAAMGSGNPFLSVEMGSSAYKVEFERIAVKLRENLMAKLVRERLGDHAARVLAVVARAGKVSETTVRLIPP
jgi:DNA-directed RNA polymerase III subunit RPC3